MSIISWIILGLIAGFIGTKIVNREGQGFWLDIALGIIGAIIGSFLFDLFGATGVTGLNIYSMIVAIVGSVVVLFTHIAKLDDEPRRLSSQVAIRTLSPKPILIPRVFADSTVGRSAIRRAPDHARSRLGRRAANRANFYMGLARIEKGRPRVRCAG